MKKILTMLALTLTITTSFAFAGENINRQALNAFQSEFTSATDVAWKVSGNYFEVAFTIGEKRLFAFYDSRGELVAVTHFISSTQLPKHLQKSLKASYGEYWISDLFEMSTADEGSYFVTIENANERIVLRSRDGSKWSLYTKTDKE